MRRSYQTLWFGLLLIFLLSACSDVQTQTAEQTQANDSVEKEEVKQPEENREPVEITFYQTMGGFNEELFNKTYGEALSRELPHYQMRFIPSTDMAQLIATNEKIDIYSSTEWGAQSFYYRYGLQYDMSDLIKKNNFDLSRFSEPMINLMTESYAGEIYGLPIGDTTPFLLYNRDLFDEFGVDYPTDDMTWDELYDVAVTMTRTENGVQYRGFDMDLFQMFVTNQLSVPVVDGKTEQATFVTDDRWQQVFGNFLRFYAIPGNEMVSGAAYNRFYKDQNVAMFANVTPPELVPVENPEFWDMARIPSFSDQMGVGPQPYSNYIYLTSMSERQEEAFEIIEFLLSEAFQMELTATPPQFVTALKSERVREQYAKNSDWYKGKNIQGRFPAQHADTAEMTPYSREAVRSLETYFISAAQGEMDMNTALRSAAEEADQVITEMKALN